MGSLEKAKGTQLSGPASGGAANRAVVDLMAVRLGVARESVRLEKSGTSRAKMLSVDGMKDDEARDSLLKVPGGTGAGSTAHFG